MAEAKKGIGKYEENYKKKNKNEGIIHGIEHWGFRGFSSVSLAARFVSVDANAAPISPTFHTSRRWMKLKKEISEMP